MCMAEAAPAKMSKQPDAKQPEGRSGSVLGVLRDIIRERAEPGDHFVGMGSVGHGFGQFEEQRLVRYKDDTGAFQPLHRSVGAACGRKQQFLGITGITVTVHLICHWRSAIECHPNLKSPTARFEGFHILNPVVAKKCAGAVESIQNPMSNEP